MGDAFARSSHPVGRVSPRRQNRRPPCRQRKQSHLAVSAKRRSTGPILNCLYTRDVSRMNRRRLKQTKLRTNCGPIWRPGDGGNPLSGEQGQVRKGPADGVGLIAEDDQALRAVRSRSMRSRKLCFERLLYSCHLSRRRDGQNDATTNAKERPKGRWQRRRTRFEGQRASTSRSGVRSMTPGPTSRTSREVLNSLRPPVARFYPCDLHVHSPGSFDFWQSGRLQRLPEGLAA